MAQHTNHSIDYVEFTSPAASATRDFFSAAFGWAMTPYGPEYTGLHDGRPTGTEAGGISAGPTRPPLVIIYSEDLDATHSAVIAAGGTVTVAPFDFPGGRRFHFTEPGGAELAVWSEGTEKA